MKEENAFSSSSTPLTFFKFPLRHLFFLYSKLQLSIANQINSCDIVRVPLILFDIVDAAVRLSSPLHPLVDGVLHAMISDKYEPQQSLFSASTFLVMSKKELRS